MSFEKYCHGGGDTEGWMEENDTPSTDESSLVQTDTPRTDAAFGQGKHGVMKMPYETSCQLERELKASQEAYLQSIERDDYLTQALAEAKQWLDERYKHLSEADERADRAEAEVERLKEQLTKAVLIADKSLDCLIPVFRGEHEELESELKKIKATLNPTDK